jgi:hypothetical protein
VTFPPDYTQEYSRRCKILFHMRQAMRHDREEFIVLMRFYAANPSEWINDFCVTFDPRAVHPNPKVMPFVLFPRQREFIQFIHECLTDRESGLVEKARDIGASWLACAYSVWLWLFHPGVAIGWGSRKKEYVDRLGDPKALLPKMRMIIDNLPDFMIPQGFDMDTHATQMRIINPANGATIIGESGDGIGRGGRTTMFFHDEAAHAERPELIEAALGDNTDVRIDMSSVNGTANVFYQRRMAGEVWMPGQKIESGKTRVFIFDWRDHPGKTQEWYDLREKKAIAEGLVHLFRQEVDRDYAGSQQRVIIHPEWIRAAIDAHIKLGIKAQGIKVAGQDVADGGADRNALAIMHGIVLRFCDHWGGDADEAAAVSIPTCIELGVDELYYETTGVGAGFKGGINALRNTGAIPSRLRVLPWNPASKPLDPDDPCIPGDPQSPTNSEQYANIKAQGYFRMRARFHKTYRAVMHGERFEDGELISIDSRIGRLQELVTELSQPVHKTGLNGKTIVDKKPEGAMSPNLADAVNIAANPTRDLSILDVL